MEAGDTILPRS